MSPKSPDLLDVGERFPGRSPSDDEHGDFVSESCKTITDAYLAPKQLSDTGLIVMTGRVPPESWAAGNRQTLCTLVAPNPNGGWETLTNSAKGDLLINGQSPR